MHLRPRLRPALVHPLLGGLVGPALFLLFVFPPVPGQASGLEPGMPGREAARQPKEPVPRLGRPSCQSCHAAGTVARASGFQPVSPERRHHHPGGRPRAAGFDLCE